MKFRNLDENGDWEYGRGEASYVVDQACIALDMATRLRSWVGNCPFDPEAGIDYKNLLGIGTKDELDQAIQETIVQTEGVISVGRGFASILDPETRALSVVTDVTTEFTGAFNAKLNIVSSPTGN